MSVLKQIDDLVNRVHSFEDVRKELATSLRQVADAIEAAPTPTIARVPVSQPAHTAASAMPINNRRPVTSDSRKRQARIMRRRWKLAKAAGRTTLG